MPVYRSRTVLEVARNLRAFLELNAGLVRGEVPDPEQANRQLKQVQNRVEQLQKQLAAKNRQIEQTRNQLFGKGRQANAAQAGQKTGADPRQNHERQEAGEAIAGEPRNHYIGKVVKGKSFVDVGGLGLAVNEKVSVARSHGASALTMIDIVPPGHELWQAFSDRMGRLGISNFDTISESILDLAESPDPPRYDVVHCTGLLYHMPDPVRFLSALHKITREHLVLGSAVTATRISGEEGTLDVPSSAALFVPALRGRERKILEDYWRPFASDSAIGLTSAIRWDPEDFTPWWWLPTVESMKAMCESTGFDYRHGAYYWNNNAYVMLLSRRPRG